MSSTADEKLDVLIVTVDEQYYIPKFLEDVLDSEHIRVVGISTVPPSLGTQNIVAFAYRLFRVFGARVFTEHVLFYAKYMLLDLFNRMLGTGEAYSPKTMAERRDIDYVHMKDVNSPEHVAFARSKSPDVIASVAPPQKFESELLDVPSDCAINVHSSLLPEYRGLSPSFWTLLYDEDQTGITVHYMDDEFDTGDVILQEPLAIRDDDTLHSLNNRVAERGSKLLLESMRQIQAGTVSAYSIDPEQGSYYSLPTREDVREFLWKGNQFY